jgi:hypothetical protein
VLTNLRRKVVAKGPETNFRNAVERNLPRTVYRLKMYNPYVGGPADSWYSGTKGDLWVEYKFLPCLPQRGTLSPKRYGLTQLQLDWLRGRHEEGRNIAVIIGVPKGGVILRDLRWEQELSVTEFVGVVLERRAISEWITQQTVR